MDITRYRSILGRADSGSTFDESVSADEHALPTPSAMCDTVIDQVSYLEHLLSVRADADARRHLIESVMAGGERLHDESVDPLTAVEAFGLEAVVHSDGSRPALFVQDDFIDVTRPEAGVYAAKLAPLQDRVRDACRAVGRVDDPSANRGFQGTAWMINDSMVVTNFHVLQAISTDPRRSGTTFHGALRPNVTVDFGHEAGTSVPGRKFPVRSVVAVGPAGRPEFKEPGAPGINFDALDLAVLELEPVVGQTLPKPVRVARADDPNTFGLRAEKGRAVYVLGFPAGPGATTGDIFEALFHGISGFKRLAPGYITSPRGSSPRDRHKWVLAHDASTLGGNSGSAVMDLDGDPRNAIGLHFGGWEKHENWAHALEGVTEMLKPWLP